MAASTGQSMSQEELFRLFQEFLAGKRQGADKFEPLKNHPLHRGLVDPNYERPAPTEYPRMMHHASLPPKIVQNRAEQEALGPAWFISPVIQKADWRAKANEVFTKSGFRVYTHHVDFLKSSGFTVETLREAAEFIDRLNETEQEQFFRDAENVEVPAPAEAVEVPKEEKKAKKAK